MSEILRLSRCVQNQWPKNVLENSSYVRFNVWSAFPRVLKSPRSPVTRANIKAQTALSIKGFVSIEKVLYEWRQHRKD